MQELKGVRVKIARASKHLEEFKAELDEFRRIPPYTIISQLDPDTGDQIWKVEGEPVQPPPFPVIGDILYNFRSALDHLAWQLVLKAGGRPGRRTEFPIFNCPDLWSRDSPRDMQGMNQAMKHLVKAHQPCFGPNPHRNLAMWSLQEYGNTDKHRTIITTVAGFSNTMFWFPGGSGPIDTHEGPVQKDTVLARFVPSEMKEQLSIMPSIAFNDPPATGQDVNDILGFIELRVTRLVDEFESAFF
jgi:hypothetical protein